MTFLLSLPTLLSPQYMYVWANRLADEQCIHVVLFLVAHSVSATFLLNCGFLPRQTTVESSRSFVEGASRTHPRQTLLLRSWSGEMDTRNGRTQYALTFSSIPNNPCLDVALPSGHASLANPSSSSPTNQDGGIRDVSTNGRAASTSRKGPEEQCKVW